MIPVVRTALLAAVAAPAALAAVSAQAEEHIYSYLPASEATTTLTPTGLSFEFEKKPFGGLVVRRIIQTGDRGSAALKGSSESPLGGDLKAILGSEKPAGRLYEIQPEGDGAAFVRAVCPGAARAWLAIGRMERFKDLPVQVIGLDEGAATARHCVTLTYSFRSEWLLPPPRNPPRARFQRSL